jgi:uncharacterized Rmd1/YagE family protein
MIPIPLLQKNSISVRALFLGERFDLKALESTDRIALAPLMVRAGDHGVVVLFRYGVVVLFDLDPLEEVSFLARLTALVTEPFAKPESEVVELRAERSGGERADSNTIWLKSFDIERLQVVADVLARTVVLAEYEAELGKAFDQVEPLAAALQRSASCAQKSKDLLRHIGTTLLIEHKMVGRVGVEDKPEILWDHPDLERLYSRLVDEYELRERHLAVDRKLELINRTAETLHKLVQDRRILRVEWYVVALIVIEIMLTICQMIAKV